MELSSKSMFLRHNQFKVKLIKSPSLAPSNSQGRHEDKQSKRFVLIKNFTVNFLVYQRMSF